MAYTIWQNGRLLLHDDAGVWWIARQTASGGMGDLGFAWDKLIDVIKAGTSGTAQIIAAKKTGIVSPIGGEGGGSGFSVQEEGGRISGGGSLDMKTMLMYAGLALLGVVVLKKVM